MLPIALAGLGLYATMRTIGWVGNSAVGLELFEQKKKLKENERAFAVDENPSLMKHKKQQGEKMMKAGIPYIPDQYVMFDIEKNDLPPQMHHLAGKWVLRDSEATKLFDMMRREMLERRIGSFGDDINTLCEKYGVPYEEVAAATWRGGPIDYSELKFFSKNRLKDPIIRTQFNEAVQQKR